jgi:very-short-patch-repair endonuclease
MPDNKERARLTKTYEQLRERHLDMSLRNPMLSYKHRPTSKRQLQIVDEVPDEVYRLLTVDGASLDFVALPEPDETPLDERTEEFMAALDHAKVADLEHLTKLQGLESAGRDDEFALAEAERELRDRIRVQLGLPPRPNRKTINPIEHARQLGIDPSLELQAKPIKEQHSDRKLQTLKWPTTLDAVLAKISDDARLAEQETGLSTLFLVFGFLEWAEREDSAKRLFAPLLLLPVKLEKRRTGRGKMVFTLAATAESADENLSLKKKLERDFARELPAFNDSDDTEAVKAVVERYFAQVSKAINGMKGWNVRRWMTLGHFTSGRFAMYADLAPENWSAHPVADELVGSIVRGTEISGDGGSSLLHPPEDYPIDEPEVEKVAPILIHDADASQHSALVDVMKGQHLVIQGPPGTGKSQTITNIIANALAANKTVLFLAEKQAALDVVKRRLDRAGLGEFCLELHSDKATPKRIIESLKLRYKLGFGKSLRASASQPDATWLESRRELSAYVSALHAPAEDDRSPFDLIWRAIRARAEVGPVLQQFKTITLPQELLDSPATYQQVLGAVSVYARMARDFVSAYGPLAQSPWNALTFADLNPAIAYGLIDDLADLRQQADLAVDLLTQSADLGATTLADLEQLVDRDQSLSRTLPDPALVARIATLEAEQVEELIALRSTLTNLEREAGQTGSPVPASDEMVALVSRLVEVTAETAWAGLPPDAIYAAAARQIADATQTKELVAALQPAFQILGLKDSFPANAVQAVFQAVYAATKLTDETRPWFVWRPEGGAEAFDRARLKWAALATAEAQWRGRFPSYIDPAWPPPDGLRAAAAAAKKGTFGRMLGAFSGEAKVLTEIVARLGLPAGTKLAAADLEALAEHAQALAAFLNDRSCQQMLGSAWKGLDTPFELIAAARNFRGAAAAKIKECPNGYQVLNGFTDLDATGLVQLAATYGTVKRVADEGPELPALDDRGLAQIAAEVAHSRAVAEAVLAVDPERRLAGIELSLPALHQRLVLETKLHGLRRRIDAHPLSAEVERLAGCDADVQATRAASTWVQAVRSHTTMPVPVREALLSQDAQAMRDRLATLAAQAGPVVSDLKGVGARIERSHGVTGFDLTAPHTLIALTADLAPRRDELTEYLSLNDQRQILADRGLASLLDFADEVGVTADLLPALFSGLVSQRRAEQARRTDPVLARAAGLRIEARRSEFVERDKRKIEADRRRVWDTLLTLIPPRGSRYGSRKTWTQMELLNNEFGKEKRFTPVRDLMGRAGEAIQTMKPCFMMSPLSLAKFLPAGALTFDLVVIDEASQMRPEDALGGMLRAQQLVVVGDQKQLPPTSFFSRAGDNTSAPTDDEDEFEDLDDESILEACQKTFRQTRLLRWHYRSRCESLIAFSNREFYRGELITFPMARPGSFSVDLIQVNGSYEAKRNPAEAQRVAEAAIAFMRQFADADPATIPTLGIVAVNTDQRDLIFEEIRQLEADDALVEQYREKVTSKGEPVFIKNLENVQGDERDFIFISMTYGPKPGQRAVLQRFGPINGKQGHRRLNVLFSRARIRIGLFTSMGSADIKPGATSSEGVHVLKRYLAYAEERGRAVVDHLGGEPDSDFEVEVAGRLRARGYSVDLQVGVSGFRIDLGVRHPDHPERYLAGVECDGARYHSSKSARDRDRLRQEVLEGLGWDIVRVWSTDWFDNPDLQTDRLVSRLEELRAKPIPAHEDYALAGHVHPDGPSAPPYVDLDETAEPSSVAEVPVRVDEPPVDLAVDKPDPAGPGVPMTVSAALLEGSGPLTEAELHQALREFRDTVIAVEMAPWEHHRSILRDSMIETLVAQQVTDSSDWFLKVPQFQRAGTNPIEKTRYLDRICDLVARMSDRRSVKQPPAFTLTPPTEPQVMRQGTLFGAPGSSSNPAASPAASAPAAAPTPTASNGHGSDRYVVADISACGVDPNPDRFYEAGYSPALSRMIAHVINTEGPLYADQLVTRIARVHGFMRSGAKIVERIMLAIDRRFPRSHEGEREVLWPAGATPQPVLPLRRSKAEDRDHNDIPLAELASLAASRLRKREDEADVVAHMRQHFGLARLHDSTRARFEAAIRIAQEHLS